MASSLDLAPGGVGGPPNNMAIVPGASNEGTASRD